MAKPTSSTSAPKKTKVSKTSSAPASDAKKSLKRKSISEAPATEEVSATASSPKKSKPAPSRAPAKPPTKAEIKSQQRKAAVAAAKNPVPHSRRKQAPPQTIPGAVVSDAEESDADSSDEEEEEVEVKQPAKKAKAATAKPSGEPKKVEEVKDVEEDADEDAEEEDTHLHGFSTDEDSSDDDEDAMDTEPSAFDVQKLPTIAKDDATVKKKLDKAKRNPTGDRGVLFLGRIPHGFYEDQMKAYFTQFGDVTRVRLSRNKKTGKSKHYGFIEFDSASVAKIVAETMDNYLLNGHIMQCKVIPKDKVHPQLWVGANRKWRAVPTSQVARAQHNKKRDEEEQYAASRRLIKRQNQRKRKLEEVGINYDFEGAGYKKIPKVVTA